MNDTHDINEAKYLLLSDISHEIRTPMNSVIGFSELLAETNLSETQKQYVNYINTSAKVLFKTINDMLDLSKIESGNVDAKICKTDIIELLDQCPDVIKSSAAEKNIELIINTDQDLPQFALIDASAIKQIITSLLDNALKRTEKGEIELRADLISSENSKGEIKFTVRYTGSDTCKPGDTDLGLVISNRLVKNMGGTLSIETISGGGSEFSFTITAGLERSADKEIRSSHGIKHCLIVEDNYNSGAALQKKIGKLGIQSTVCENGMKAVKAVENNPDIDMIICDYSMPYLNGVETVRMIRKKTEDRNKEIPVILLHTSSEEMIVREQSTGFGIKCRMIKPVKQRELLNCIINLTADRSKQPAVETNELTNNSEIIEGEFRILIAEDNSNNMKLVKIIMSRFVPSSKIISAVDGSEAFQKAIGLKPDIILMDVQMPVMNGNDATVKIREYEKENGLDSVPVIGLTAGASDEDRKKSLESGMNEFLTKPINRKELLSVLSNYLKSDRKYTNDHDERTNETEIVDKNKHFNEKDMMELLKGNKKLLREIIEVFRKDISGNIIRLEEYLCTKSYNNASNTAYVIKSNAADLRCYVLQDLTINIETLIREEKYDESIDMLFKIKEEWNFLQEIFNQNENK